MIIYKQVVSAKETEIERRNKSDRRSFSRATQFPVINRNGKVIKQDRRSRPDRRIANIHVIVHHVYAKKECCV